MLAHAQLFRFGHVVVVCRTVKCGCRGTRNSFWQNRHTHIHVQPYTCFDPFVASVGVSDCMLVLVECYRRNALIFLPLTLLSPCLRLSVCVCVWMMKKSRKLFQLHTIETLTHGGNATQTLTTSSFTTTTTHSLTQRFAKYPHSASYFGVSRSILLILRDARHSQFSMWAERCRNGRSRCVVQRTIWPKTIIISQVFAVCVTKTQTFFSGQNSKLNLSHNHSVRVQWKLVNFSIFFKCRRGKGKTIEFWGVQKWKNKRCQHIVFCVWVCVRRLPQKVAKWSKKEKTTKIWDQNLLGEVFSQKFQAKKKHSIQLNLETDGLSETLNGREEERISFLRLFSACVSECFHHFPIRIPFP